MTNKLLQNKFFAFLKLIRFENLLIMVFTLYCMRYFVVQSLLTHIYFSDFNFIMLVISTTLIAAAGYIINDYFDVKTDFINRPETVVIDKVIKRRTAMFLHIIFSATGLLLGALIAWRCMALRVLLFQIIAVTLLWFYSTNFKKQLITGNLIIGILTGLIPLMPISYEIMFGRSYNPLFMEQHGHEVKMLLIISLIFSGFAFLTSIIREIIKDMEDYEGDIQTGSHTMPIVWGIITTKTVTFFLIIITQGLLTFSIFKLWQWHHKTSSFYLIMTVFFPLLILLFQVIKAKIPFHYKTASLLLKLIMLFGVAFTFIIKLIYERY